MIKHLLTIILVFLSFNLFGQNFTALWDTQQTSTGSSAADQIEIPTNPAFTYNYMVDWGDGSSDSNVTANIIHTYTSPGIYTISISGTFPAIYFNDEGDTDKIIEILTWGTIEWLSMENAFYGCTNLNFDLIDAPDLSQVTTLQNMFYGCTSFNGIVNNWDVSTITNLSGLFKGCSTFNRPLDLWDTSSVTDMSETFYSANSFNEPLDNWNTASVTTMYRMFYNASSFNQDINNWIVSNVTNMSGTFYSTGNFNSPLNNWIVSNVTDMSSMFNSSIFNQSIGNWDVSQVTNFSSMFQRNRNFNQPLNSWIVDNATNMSSMFDGYYWGQAYNYPLDSWNVTNVTNMSNMFRDNSNFNQDITGWDVSNVENMSGMFEDTDAFNQNISAWIVSSVTNMEKMFYDAAAFDQPLNTWDVSNVISFREMFYRAKIFNQPLDNWVINTGTTMYGMFSYTEAFDQDISGWDVSNVSNMYAMFSNAAVFNQDISGWDTSSVTNMANMFYRAFSFNQNIGSFNISAVSNLSGMLSESGISQENYDNILIAWSGQTVKPGLTLGATTLQYCDALTQRQSLIDTHGWTITGDDVNCSYVLCTQITMPHSGDTFTPANSDIRWDPAPNATGYRITLEVERGGTRSYVNISGTPANNYDVGNVVGLDFTNEFTVGDTVYVTVVPYNAEGPATGCSEISFTVVESWVNSPDAFKLTYDTNLDNSYTSDSNQLRIGTNSGLSYDYSIDWGDGQYDNNVTGSITHTYLTPGIYTVSIIGEYPAPYNRYTTGDAYKLLSIDQWGSQVWQSMQRAFYDCENMEYNATDVPTLTNVTSMSEMFYDCNVFNGNINNWNVSNVTDMTSMFSSASIFNQPLDTWDVSNVTSMDSMFAYSDEFNQDITGWTTSSVTTMSNMFAGTEDFNQAIDLWNVSNVTDMSYMFSNADSFNQPLDSWDVSKVETMQSMFYDASVFNASIDAWDVSSVTTMYRMFRSASVFNQALNNWNPLSLQTTREMFYGADAFDQPIDQWDVTSVLNMASMFYSADSFNQDIDSWGVTNVTDMSFMFSNAVSFNMPLNSWDVNSVVNMSSMFEGASVFNQPLEEWEVSAVANMSNMFEDAIAFNQPLNTWDVSSVTLMPSMFEGATVYDQEMYDWDVAVVTNFEAMFKNAAAFNKPLNMWKTGEALTMEAMFYGATLFDQDLNSWNTTFVTTMEDMFRAASAFNQSLNSWNVASVRTMESMFENAIAFNENIDGWNVRAVTTMADMFSGATSFNQSLNSWRTNNVTSMDRMFQNATALDQSFDQWLIGDVSMRAMFHDATALNQYFGDWDISGVTNMLNMLDDTALSRENYDNTLIAWSEQTLTPGITLGAATLPYCDAQEERQSMIDTYGWTFSLDVRDCPIPSCTQLLSPLNGAIDVPVNTNITWEHALYAQGYHLTVGTTTGGTDILDNETITNETFYEFTSDFNTGDTVYVTLIPFNDEGDAVGPCLEESFTISNTSATIPNCTTLTLPVDGDTDIAIDTDLNWTAISNADGYKITVGTTVGGSDILDNEDVGNSITYDFTSDLEEDTTYYVTITPYNEEGEPLGCSAESFTTEFIPVAPACTSLASPFNGATNVAITADLSWNLVPNATGYLVSVGTTTGGIEVVNNINVGNMTTYSFTDDLRANRMHYVTITPYNAVGDALGCSEETFTTGDGSPTVPGCTTLTTPLNSATDVAIDSDLNWNLVSDATGYKLTVGTTPGGTDILNNEDVGNTNTYNFTADFDEATTIYVSITPYNAVGDATGCAEESFTTETLPTVPNCTMLSTPTNTANNIALDTELTWNIVSDATGYILTVGTTSGGTDILNNEDVGNTNTYNFTADFDEATTIYVTITPYNTVGNATGCAEESFTTLTTPTIPNCTTLAAPLSGAIDVAITTDLTWNAVPNADGYKVSVGTTSGGTDILNDENVGNTNSYDFTADFNEATTIYVTITPYNTIGDAMGCTEEFFTTEILTMIPNCTSLIAPLNGETDVAIDSDLTWNTIANADGYKLTVGTTSGGTDILDNEDVGNINTYVFSTDFEEATTIYASITPYNAAGDATGCTEESFTTETIIRIPNCTSLTAPTNEAINVATDVSVSWEAITNADGYRISMGTTPGGTDILNNDDVGLLTSYELMDDLPFESTIYVTITAYNSFGDAVGCSEESFTTEIEPLIASEYGFSPNGDGINEFWEIKGIENSPDNIVNIYNRWGDLVFTIANYDNQSNVFRGEANKLLKSGAGTLPNGTYFFDIQITGTHNLKKLKGFVVLKR